MGQNERYINESGILIDINGNHQNMLDFIATKDFQPRYYDFNTKNKSFLNVHVLLKRLGVKNNKEHLQIFHPELIGVDPFNIALPNNVKEMIFKEIVMNPWYYFREIVKINVSGKLVRFRLGIESFSSIFFMTRRRNILLTAPRQVGKTIGLLSFLSWLLNFRGKDLKIGNIHYKADRAIGNLNKVEEILDNLPEYLKFHKKTLTKPDKDGSKAVKDKSKSSNKKTSLECEIFGNVIENHVVGQDPASANNTGRGTTIPVWLIDEIAHIKYNDIAMTAFSPAYSEAKNVARRHGDIFGIWTICTPGDLKTDEGSWVWNEINEEYFHLTPDKFKCFDMTEEELEDFIGTYSRKGTTFISYIAEELGYDDKWIKEKSKSLDINGVRSEVLLKWEIHTNDSPFPPYLINNLETTASALKKTQVEFELDDVGNVITYYPRSHYHSSYDFHSYLQNFWDGLILGIDVAFGVGGNSDSTTIVALNAKTLEVAFTYKNNEIIVDDFALFLIRLIDEYFIPNDIKVAISIERNSNGRSLIGILKKYKDYEKFFIVYPSSEYKIKNAIPSDFKFDYKGIKNMAFDMGLDVNKNRSELMNLFIQVVHKYTDCVAVFDIVEEIKTLVIKKTYSGETRIEHADGKHDDLLFAIIQAIYAIFRNSDLIEKRNRISINPETFLINKNSISINSTGRINKRVVVSYKSVNGKIIAEYYDKVQGILVDRETAERLEKEDMDKFILSNDKKENLVVDPIDISNEYLEEHLRESGASNNIKIVSPNNTIEDYRNTVEYDNWLMNLL